MTKHWQAIAQAQGIEIPAAEWDRIAPPLDAVERAFRQLTAGLPSGLEPALGFSAEEGSE